MPPFTGAVCLAGRPHWLLANEPAWKVLMESGHLSICSLPIAEYHDQVVSLPAARAWVDVLRRMVESEPI